MFQVKKKIVLGVTGSIAAYKACDILRELRRKGFDVRVVMTNEAQRFLSPINFSALSGNPVANDLFSPGEYGPIPHCKLAEEIDALLVAPATAQIIAKFAHGFADDLLSALFLVTKSPVIIAPAMNPNMYSHPMVQKNIDRLKDEGICIIDPIQAEVACGQTGKGHLASVESICERVVDLLSQRGGFEGLKILVTAGPTREFIDPIRFISNRSTGKMGFFIAEAAKDRGAEVILISGPTNFQPPAGVHFRRVTTSDDMQKEVERVFSGADVVFMAAAVADFKPSEIYKKKRKKENGLDVIQLERTVDILSKLGKEKKKGQILVGFAAEDHNTIQNAEKKLREKRLDIIAACDVSVPGSGFESDMIQITLIHKTGEKISIPLSHKRFAANEILNEVKRLLI